MKNNIEKTVINILKNIDKKDYSIEEQIVVLSKVNKLYQVMYEDDDYGYSFEILILINQHLGYLYEKIGNLEKSEQHYNYSKCFLEDFKKVNDNYQHTSLLFKNEKCINSKKLINKIKKLDYKIECVRKSV